MIRTAALLVLLASPALAQDADPHNQLAEGYMACMSGGGQVDLTESVLDAAGWSRADGGEDGLVYFTPGAGDAVRRSDRWPPNRARPPGPATGICRT